MRPPLRLRLRQDRRHERLHPAGEPPRRRRRHEERPRRSPFAGEGYGAHERPRRRPADHSPDGCQKRTQNLLAALRDGDREYRGAALDFAGDFADEALYAAVVRKMPSLTEQARTDIVNWLGARHAASQTDAVVAMIGSDDDELAAAAIRAAGKIGGTKALEALIACLDGPHAAEASAALLAFNGNVNEGVLAALDGAPSTQVHALKLAAARRIAPAADKVFALLASEDAAVRTAAADALAGVTTVGDFDRLCDLLDQTSGEEMRKVQDGLKNALAAQPADVQFDKVSARMAAAKERTRYYPLLAQAGSREAIDALLAADDRDAAFAALLTVDNAEMIGVLSDLAARNPAWKDKALARYTDFVAIYAPAEERPALYCKGLEADPSADVQNRLLRALAATYSFPSIEVAARYLGTPATAEAAAFAVKTIAAKNPGMGGETVVNALEKAQEVYAALAKSDADAGYAVDEIKGLLAKYAAVPRFELSPGRGGRRLRGALRRTLDGEMDRQYDQLRAPRRHDRRDGAVRRFGQPLHEKRSTATSSCASSSRSSARA